MIPLAAIPSWVADAVCASVDPALFDQGADVNQARRICGAGTENECPVLDLCREYAIADPSLDGTWGGTTKNERTKIRIERLQETHGTPAAYQRHIRAGNEPCDACRAANAKTKRRASMTNEQYQQQRRERAETTLTRFKDLVASGAPVREAVQQSGAKSAQALAAIAYRHGERELGRLAHRVHRGTL